MVTSRLRCWRNRSSNLYSLAFDIETVPDTRLGAELLALDGIADEDVAKAMMFPSISLTGIFGAASTELSALTTGDPAWSISGSLLGPLFNFNKNTLRVEIEEEKIPHIEALFRRP